MSLKYSEVKDAQYKLMNPVEISTDKWVVVLPLVGLMISECYEKYRKRNPLKWISVGICAMKYIFKIVKAIK